MNIYTVTLIHRNYGSLLQAFALQSCLRDLGASPSVVLKETEKKHSKVYLFFGGIYSDIRFVLTSDPDYPFIKRIKLRLDDLKFKRKYAKLNTFIENKISKITIKDEKEFLNSIPSYSIFLSGSDQIWSSISKLPWFALEWVGKSYPKFSYAASLGRSSVDDEELKTYIDKLSSFQVVSLREKQAANFFTPFIGEKVRQDLDPSLLYDKQFWRKVQSPRIIKEPYVFVYRLRPNDDVFELARRVAKEKNCKIVYTGSYAYRAKDVQTIFDAGIEDFLSYIDHSEAVITNSFHGTAFSVIYEKPFLSAKVASTGSRADSLLTLLGLRSQYVEDVKKEYSLDIDYSKVNILLEKERTKSWDYLKAICSK